jgi:Trypsin
VFSRIALLLAAGCAALPAPALLIRPDREDAEYLELASRYGSALALQPEGEGVLIAPRWILTAAHRAQAIKHTPRYKLRIDGAEHEVAAAHVHPGWRAGDSSNDIGLLQLRTDVKGIEPTPIYRVEDEAGKTVVLVGHGATGMIGARATAKDGRKRAAINTVDRLRARTLELDLKGVDEASDLQGAITPGESGAPLYADGTDGLSVLGIACCIDDRNGDGLRNTGDRDIFARVAAFAGWIDSVLLEAARKEVEDLLGAR